MELNRETRNHVNTCQRQLPSSTVERKVAFGFDGVIDRVRTIIASRSGPDNYERMDTLQEFGTRIVDAAALDTSCSIEWFCDRKRAGGHTSHLGRAMEQLGHQPTIIGTFGTPPHETFTNEYERTKLVSIGAAPVTDAIEFDDGKVLLSETRQLADLDWDHICSTIGLKTLVAAIDRTELLGIGYWATIPQMSSIWEGLCEDLWSRLRDPPSRVLIDPADISRLSTDVLTHGVASLDALNDTVPVTMSANHREALCLANVLDLNADRPLLDVAAALRDALGVSEVVVHTVSEAVLATADDRCRVVIPREPEPKMTTSAGDHFNAGLSAAKLAGVNSGAQLVAGSAVAGWFVRNGRPPTYDELRSFVGSYEARFEESSPS